ncbi:MAG: alpha/beta fold hydrolase [Candidatus Rokubacteria bacterium]|nr:alpha/beta fold hydrolase [Candidatus Rokubacteria bacterium]
MGFSDREEAGRQLAERLAALISPPSVLAAIPRGGVAVALPAVRRLRLPLTVVYARKLTAPIAPELAFGALDEDGEVLMDADIVAQLELRPEDIEAAKTRVGAEIRRRMALYKVPPLEHYLPGSGVVLIDDGLATGLTMLAALAYARRHGARDVTVAVPCAAGEAARRFRREADRFLSLIVDESFVAVGNYYRDFSPVSDQQVLAMLARSGERDIAGNPWGLALSFTNARGLRLSGTLLTPATGGPHPAVVFAHGWGSGQASPRNRKVAEELVAEGFAALLFDFTGHGDSEGTETDSTLDQQVDDLGAAIGLLEALDEVDSSRVGVMGASSGGAVALLTAAQDARIRALVLRSANPTGAKAAASAVNVPTLLIVGEYDEPIRAANEELLAGLTGPARLEVVPGGDHLFGDLQALGQAARLTTAWFGRHLR